MDNVDKMLRLHKKIFPQMQVEDFVKLLYQSAFGTGHIVNGQDSLFWMEKECMELSFNNMSAGGMIVPLLNGFVRVGLREYIAGGFSAINLAKAFTLSTVNTNNSDLMKSYLNKLRSQIEVGLLIDKASAYSFLTKYEKDNMPALTHSAIYKNAYLPSYRVVHSKFLPILLTSGQ
ncbi:MAG: hypothetical protein PHX51_06975 [Clostridia bacterium]|nr:hypothetical protein [Clostridia bacterium]